MKSLKQRVEEVEHEASLAARLPGEGVDEREDVEGAGFSPSDKATRIIVAVIVLVALAVGVAAIYQAYPEIVQGIWRRLTGG